MFTVFFLISFVVTGESWCYVNAFSIIFIIGVAGVPQLAEGPRCRGTDRCTPGAGDPHSSYARSHGGRKRQCFISLSLSLSLSLYISAKSKQYIHM